MDQAYYDAVGTSRGRLPAVPLAGDTPQRYTFLSRITAVHVGQVIVGVLRPYRKQVPDSDPGLAFVPIAHAGWRRHTRV